MNPEHAPSPAAAKPSHWVVMTSPVSHEGEVLVLGYPGERGDFDSDLVSGVRFARLFATRDEAVSWIRGNQNLLASHRRNAFAVDLNGDPFAPMAAEPAPAPSADLSSLTPRQMEIYQFIRAKIVGRGYGPTVREMGLEFSIKSPNGIICHLKALQKKGLITREPNMSRAISLA